MTTTPETVQPTIEQRRARHAWRVVEHVAQAAQQVTDKEEKKKAENSAKQFGGQAKRLPMRIIAAGLGQALSFLLAKKYAPELLIALSDWVLHKPVDVEKHKLQADKDTLIKAIINGDADFLRRATDESLAYLRWVVRFADAQGLTDDTPEGEV